MDLKNRALILPLLLLLPLLTLAMPRRYAVRQLGIQQGLSNNNVVSIAQDKEGFVWIATEEGLNRFDGTRFDAYYKQDHSPFGITGNELNCLLDDPVDSVLWIGTQRAGLNAYNYANNTFTYYQHHKEKPESIITDDITDIAPSTDGSIWIATFWHGIDYFDKQHARFIHYNKKTVPTLVSNSIWTVTEDGNGQLYIGHVHHGLSILSLKSRRVRNFMYDPHNPHSLPGNEVRCVYRDTNNNIWVGTNHGLALFNPDTEEFIRFGSAMTQQRSIYDIQQLDDNTLWLAIEFGGIAILDLSQRLFTLPEQCKFQYIREGDDGYSLTNPSVRCIFQDVYKNVWIGVWGGGVNFISHKPQLFDGYYYSSDQSPVRLTNKTASSISFDTRGRLWIGTDGGGIDLFDKGNRIAVYPPDRANTGGVSVQTSLCDTDGNLWFGLFYGGVDYFDAQRNQYHRNALKEMTGQDVRAFYEDTCHILWIGTSNGIYKVDMTKKKVIGHYTFGNNLARCMLRDSKGRMWVGTFGNGLMAFDDTHQKFYSLAVDSMLPSQTVNALYQDSQQNVWVGTGEGLACFSPDSDTPTHIYRRDSGLSNTHIRAIAEDQQGNIWVSCNKGISCLLHDTDTFLNYDHRDNIPLGNFMSGSMAQDNSGKIYFGSVNGLCYFDPTTVLAEQTAPPAAITEMKVFAPLSDAADNEETVDIHRSTSIKLNYQQNNFSISFNIQNYALMDRVEYAYMLKGLDNRWYIADEHHQVAFRNIPAGKYRFVVKTRIRNQVWSKQTTGLDIAVIPPPWLTWWAKLGYVLLTVCIGYMVLHAYKKRLDMEALYDMEKKNREREQTLNDERLRFFTNITHELRTPLTLILGPLEDIQKSPTLVDKDAQKISLIRQSALRLLSLINQILEFRKVETQNKKLCVGRYNLATLIGEIGAKYKELNRKSSVEIVIKSVPDDDLTLYFDKEVVTIIVDNLMSNALKYTDRGEVTLSAYLTERAGIRYTEICVSDTGQGIDAEALPHVFERFYQGEQGKRVSGTGIGLALVKSLVELHEGEISVESALNKGSTFRFTLLTDNTYPYMQHIDSDASIPETESSEIEKDSREETSNDKSVLLIVEDNPDICHYIAESFADRFDVKVASNGQQGLEQALLYIPDIIISDIMMPVMDGITLCRRLKSDVRTSHIPIILLTAKDSLEDKEEGYETGADSYLTKPFSATLLHSRVNNLLETRRKLAEQFAAHTTRTNPIEEKRTLLAESLNKLDREFLDKVTALIEEHLSSEKIDIPYLSDKLCMSGSTLYRKIRALTGLSTNEYIRKVKLQHAERLLLEGKYQVSEVAFKVGFNSVVYFRQCFKDEFGVPPSEYLKKLY